MLVRLAKHAEMRRACQHRRRRRSGGGAVRRRKSAVCHMCLGWSIGRRYIRHSHPPTALPLLHAIMLLCPCTAAACPAYPTHTCNSPLPRRFAPSNSANSIFSLTAPNDLIFCSLEPQQSPLWRLVMPELRGLRVHHATERTGRHGQGHYRARETAGPFYRSLPGLENAEYDH
jgi:hypothetical protein